MLRLNLALLCGVLATAFYLVHVQYESRRLYTELDRAHRVSQRLEVEREQLEVQRRAQATSSRVQQLAQQRLYMRPANPAITEYVKAPPPVVVSAALADAPASPPQP